MIDDIDPDRKFSNGADWDNSIDWDDASDGSDGGYDRHGSPISANAMKELVQLRMETSRLRAENERLREALRDCVSALKHPIRPINNDGSLLNNIKFEVGRDMAVNAALRRVRAAYLGEKKDG